MSPFRLRIRAGSQFRGTVARFGRRRLFGASSARVPVELQTPAERRQQAELDRMLHNPGTRRYRKSLDILQSHVFQPVDVNFGGWHLCPPGMTNSDLCTAESTVTGSCSACRSVRASISDRRNIRRTRLQVRPQSRISHRGSRHPSRRGPSRHRTRCHWRTAGIICS